MIESLEDMLIRHEGMILHAYQDSLGFWSIGVGRLIDKRRGGGISEAEARYLLKNDIQRVVQEAQQFEWYDKLNDARKIAICDMLFNLGKPGFLTFRRMLAALERGNYAEAAKEMMDSKWAQQVGRRATELAEIMRTGELRGSV